MYRVSKVVWRRTIGWRWFDTLFTRHITTGIVMLIVPVSVLQVGIWIVGWLRCAECLVIR